MVIRVVSEGLKRKKAKRQMENAVKEQKSEQQREIDTQMAQQMASQQQSAMPETWFETQAWINDPQARQMFKHIVKDLPLANLDKTEVALINEHLDLMLIQDKMGASESARQHLHEIMCIANVSVAKLGFGRRMVGTTEQRVKFKRSEEERKKSLFGR